LGRALLPDLGAATHALDDPLNLPRRDGHAAGLLPMPLGFQAGRLIGSFPTYEFGPGRRITRLQTQRGGHRIVALILALVAVVIPLQLEVAKNPLNPNRFPALARLSGVGLARASTRSAACWSNQPTNAWADLKTAVRTRISNCATAFPCDSSDSNREISRWISSSWARRISGGIDFFLSRRCSGGFPR